MLFWQTLLKIQISSIFLLPRFCYQALFIISILQVEISGVINAGQFGRIGIDDIWFNGDCLSNGIVVKLKSYD